MITTHLRIVALMKDDDRNLVGTLETAELGAIKKSPF